MNTKALNSLADLILRAQEQDRTPMGIAFAVDAAGRHMSPETAAELARLAKDNERLQARVSELETSARGCDGEGCVLPHSSWCTRAREFAAQHSGCTCGEPWKDTPQSHAGHCWLLSPPWDEMEWHRKRVAELLARVAELESERHVTNEALSDAAEQLRENRDRIAELETGRERLAEAMQHGQHWRGERLVSERTLTQREIRALTGIPLRVSTEDEYRYCGADLGRTEFPFSCYRRVAHQGPCGDRPDPEPLAGTVRTATRMTEDPHDSPLHHTYAKGRDLPEMPRG
ncbi:hypothetical protein ACTVZO_05190 [Streptomyces sp. IBSNAI002]|uniref:hypothetical protein n=1 Tax=Streptomyces sp. IBSNAI002 TaxID=3457500 RepID=UPI003FD459E3